MIKVSNLTKKFGDFVALDNVTCSIADGCIYGMVGSNGAGKSTFLRILAGVYKQEGGEALMDDEVVYDNPSIRSRVAFIADDLYFLPGASMNGMAKHYMNFYESFDYDHFLKLADTFKLDIHKNLSHFSKGMRRQAAIILALSTRAKYMFFDETFDGLDPVMRHLVKSLVCQEVAENNATVILTSHSLRELEDICDHLALFHKGGLVLDSDVLELKTSQFKVQVAFDHEFNESLFWDMNISKYYQLGSVANMIVSGDKEETLEKFRKLGPVLLEVLPLTLEEVFTYEMDALGYNFEAGGEEDE